MALDASQLTLSGFRFPSTDTSSLATPPDSSRLDNVPVQIAQNFQAGLTGFKEGFDITQKVQERARQVKLQKNLDNKLPRDANVLDLGILDAFTKNVGGEAPMTTDADGRSVYDMKAIKNLMANRNALQFEADGGFGSDKLTPLQAAALEQLAKSGNLAYAYDQDTGKLKSTGDLMEALQQVPAISPEDAVALQDQMNLMETNLQKFEEIRALTQKEGVVGPLAGGKGGRLWAWVKAMGGDDEIFRDQRDVEIFANREALKAAEAMKGALSDNDIKFLKDSLAKLSDTPELWGSWLDELALKTRQALETRRAGYQYMPGATKATPIPGYSNPMTGTPAAASLGGTDFSRYDQEPSRAGNVPNSVILRGTLITHNGAPAIKLPNGKAHYVSDSTWRWVNDIKNQAKAESAAPAPAPVPAPAPAPAPSLSTAPVNPVPIGARPRI